jgi:fumarate hydratase class II
MNVCPTRNGLRSWPDQQPPTRSKSTRSETDSFGPIDVPADRYWGRRPNRSRQNFRIGLDRMPTAIVAYRTSNPRAQTNRELRLPDARRATAITITPRAR